MPRDDDDDFDDRPIRRSRRHNIHENRTSATGTFGRFFGGTAGILLAVIGIPMFLTCVLCAGCMGLGMMANRNAQSTADRAAQQQRDEAEQKRNDRAAMAIAAAKQVVANHLGRRITGEFNEVRAVDTDQAECRVVGWTRLVVNPDGKYWFGVTLKWKGDGWVAIGEPSFEMQ